VEKVARRKVRVLIGVVVAFAVLAPAAVLASSRLISDGDPVPYEAADELAARLQITGGCSQFDQALLSGDATDVAAMLTRSGISVDPPIGVRVVGYTCAGGGDSRGQWLDSVGLTTIFPDGSVGTLVYVATGKRDSTFADLVERIGDAKAVGGSPTGMPVIVGENAILVPADQDAPSPGRIELFENGSGALLSPDATAEALQALRRGVARGDDGVAFVLDAQGNFMEVER